MNRREALHSFGALSLLALIGVSEHRTVPMEDIKLFGKWVPVFPEGPRPQYLEAVNQPFSGVPELAAATLAQVNQWVFKNITYKPDVDDYWSTAEQTLKSRYGDCEDIAILKRAILQQNGYQDDQLVFLIVNDIIVHQLHALLLVDNRFILDSRTYHVLPHEQVQDYVPIKAYTTTQTWTFGQ